MKTISKLQRTAVRFKWRQLGIWDASGAALPEPTFEPMVSVGFSRCEARRNERLIAAMRVLRNFFAPMKLNPAGWALKERELRALRCERFLAWCDARVEVGTDVMWEAQGR